MNRAAHYFLTTSSSGPDQPLNPRRHSRPAPKTPSSQSVGCGPLFPHLRNTFHDRHQLQQPTFTTPLDSTHCFVGSMASAGRDQRAEGESDHSMDEDDYFQVIVQSEGQQGYMFEPEYSEEQLRRRDEEEAAAAAAVAARQAAGGAPAEDQRVGSDFWCLCTNCMPMDTEEQSLCCHEFHRAQFLLDELLTEREARGDAPGLPICVTLHGSFGPSIDRHMLEIYFRVPKKNWAEQPEPAGVDGMLLSLE